MALVTGFQAGITAIYTLNCATPGLLNQCMYYYGNMMRVVKVKNYKENKPLAKCMSSSP